MATITARAMHRRNAGSGFFHRKQKRLVAKGHASGRLMKTPTEGLFLHVTKGLRHDRA